MKNTFKKMTILAVGVLLGLVACGNNNNDPTTTAPAPTTVETPTTPEPTTPEPTTPTPSTPAPTTPTPENVDGNVRLEAENGSLGATNLVVKESGLASNGKYISGLTDCAHGIFFIHYAPIGGEREVEIAYFTAQPNSKHELVVNGNAQNIVYEENTGLGEEATKVGKVTATITLEQGYNTISLSKKGYAYNEPAYGGYAEVDYIEIKGSGETFDKDALVYNLDQIKIEAELGKINSSALPVPIDGNCSNGYIVGEINAAGNGAEFHFNFPVSGRYALQIAYGKDGGARDIDITFDETNYTYALEDYAGQAWNVFNLSNTAAVLDIETGNHVLNIARAETGNWFCFDYILLTKIAETEDAKIEAEDAVLDGTRVKVSENAAASNGYMACDMNDCGQGLAFTHFAHVAGEHVLEVAYWTGSAGSKTDVYVNNVKQGTIVYEENTGWADGAIPAATTSININLKAGYNVITVIKYGTGDDNPSYGGWAQIDYFLIKGGKEYNPNIAVDNTLSIQYEAELGNFHSGESCPVGMAEAQNGYIVGGINAAGDGSDMVIRVPETGTYELRIIYGKDAGERAIDIILDDTSYTYNLEDYDGQAWNVFHTSNVAATLSLTAGQAHNLSITRAENSNWFCFDAIVLTKVA